MAKCNCASSLDGHLPHKCTNEAVEGGNLCQRCRTLADARKIDDESELRTQATAPIEKP